MHGHTSVSLLISTCVVLLLAAACCTVTSASLPSTSLSKERGAPVHHVGDVGQSGYWAGVFHLRGTTDTYWTMTAFSYNNTYGPFVAKLSTYLVDVALNDSTTEAPGDFLLQQEHSIAHVIRGNEYEGFTGTKHLVAAQPKTFKPVTFKESFGPCSASWMQPTKKPYPSPILLESALTCNISVLVKLNVSASLTGVPGLSNKQRVSVPVDTEFGTDYYSFETKSHFEVTIQSKSGKGATIGDRFASLKVGCDDKQTVNLKGNKSFKYTHRFSAASDGHNYVALVQQTTAANNAAQDFTLELSH